MKSAIGIVLALLTLASPAGAQASLAWNVYPDTSAADAVALYRYQASIDGAPTMLAPVCIAASCSAPLPAFVEGSTHTLTLRVACASTPTLFGQPTPPLTWTVGGRVPPPLSVPPPPANACAPVGPPPPPAATPSPNGTYATTLVDCSGGTWVIASRRATLRNGAHIGVGYADKFLLLSCVVYADASGAGWWRASLNPDVWTFLPGGDPRGTALPPPSPATVAPPTVVPITCKISVANKPDARTGWGVQFMRDGVNVGGRDTTGPFERSVAYAPGPHTWQAVWTKSGVPSVTVSVQTTGCQGDGGAVTR